MHEQFEEEIRTNLYCIYCKEIIYDNDYKIVVEKDYEKYYHTECYKLMNLHYDPFGEIENDEE